MYLRNLLGAVVLLAIVAAAATVSTPEPATIVLNIELKKPHTTTSISFNQSSTQPTDHEDLLPPQTTTTLYIAAPESTTPNAGAVSGSTLSTTTDAPTTTTISSSSSQSGFDSGAESAFYSNINSLRASEGLPTLTRDSGLDAEARGWAQTMASAGALSHSDLGRLIPPWSAVAENVGNGPGVSSIFSALSASSGHLSNMTGDYTDVGIGVWLDDEGILWTVHIFTY